MKIEVLGVNCPKCMKTEEIFRDAASKLGIPAEVVHVSDLNEIMDRGVMMTPAVFIDGVMVLLGKVPTRPQAELLLKKLTQEKA